MNISEVAQELNRLSREIIHHKGWKAESLVALNVAAAVMEGRAPSDAWISVKDELPKIPEGKTGVLCTVTIKFMSFKFIRLATFTNDLYKVDSDMFPDAHHSGFYGDDSETGYYEEMNVVAWQYAPEPYEGD